MDPLRIRKSGLQLQDPGQEEPFPTVVASETTRLDDEECGHYCPGNYPVHYKCQTSDAYHIRLVAGPTLPSQEYICFCALCPCLDLTHFKIDYNSECER